MVECGDIVKTPFGYMIVEIIKDDETLIGHELKGIKSYHRKDKNYEIVNSDFRYKQCDTYG